MLYLTEKEWSSRYGSDFFTISLTSRSVFESTPADNAENPNVDHFHHPAVYFNIIVKCGREEKLCQRRYSQFRQLYDDILKNSQSTNNERSYRSSTTQGALQALHFPPKTCFFTKMDEESLDIRQEELFDFLKNLLKIPSASEHPVVREFLRLNDFGTE